MAGNALTVTPVGSCRIAGPLRASASIFGSRINKARSYGYTHSGLEAVQQIRFLQERYHPSEEAWPLMSLNHELAELRSSTHHRSDLYVIEISSQKQLTYKGHAIQSNYLQKRFRDFFSVRSRAVRFWEAVDRGVSEQWLLEHWPGEDRRRERGVLRNVKRTIATSEMLSGQLHELQDRLDEFVVITHVNARKSDGTFIRSRSDFIEVVKTTCGSLGIPCYDPTDLMQIHGQAFAIEDESSSLAHYTKPFEGEIAKDLFSFLGLRKKPSKGMPVEAGRWSEHNGDLRNALKSALELFQAQPSAARASWLAKLHGQVDPKPRVNYSTLIEIAQYLDFGTAYRMSGTDVARASLLDSITTQKQRIEIVSVLSDIHPISKTLEIAHRLRGDCDDTSELALGIAKQIPHWLSQAIAISEITQRLAALMSLHEIAPGNRQITIAVREVRSKIHQDAKVALATRDFQRLEQLANANLANGFGLIEIDVLWCRCLQMQENYEASLGLAEGLLERRPDHLTSWILMMRAFVHTGQLDQAQRAAARVQDIGRTGSPKHVIEAQAILDAA